MNTDDAPICTCGATLPPGRGGYVEGHDYVCGACLLVWNLNLYRDDCDIVIVQHEPAEA